MADLDRGASGSGWHGKKKLPRTITVTLILAILFTASLSLLPNPSSDIPRETAPIPARIVYASHSNISINGNAQFNHTNFPNNGVVSGNGSASNPYIIEGWDINVGVATAGINVQNTNAHFVIRDCYVHGDGSHWDIHMLSAINGIVSNNTCSNNWFGISLDTASNNNTINNNNCSNNQYGIYLYSSSNNTLSNNTCSSNGQYGICFQISCNNNTISNNNCSSNSYDGINLQLSCNNNILSNNTCSSNSDLGIDLYSSCNNNTINNNNCSNNDDGIYLKESSNNTLSNNNCSSNKWAGIELYSWCNNSVFSNNNCSSNDWYGIDFFRSSNNVLFCNTFWNNVRHGIRLYSPSSNNKIWNNSFSGNNGGGVQAYDTGTNNRWNTSGTPHGYGNYWSTLTGPDNNFDGIVDWSYNLTGGVKDYYPLTTPTWPIPEFSEIIIPMVGLMLIALIVGRTRKKP
jgi:parallel beta-helix repeat protein